MAVISFKCPNCDGELLFDPSSGKYKCEYCLSLFSQQELDEMKPATAEEQVAPDETGFGGVTDMQNGTGDMQNETEDAQNGTGDMQNETEGAQSETESIQTNAEGDAVIYSCPSCGAEIVTDATTAATFCYYCHNPVVLGGRLEGKYLPNKIIPFGIDKKEAEERFLEYVKSKKFVPRAFFNKKQIEKLSGVYFPYWVYDAEIQGNVQAEAKNIRVWRSGDDEYTETKIYHVVRQGDVNLRNLAESALQKANKQLVEGVLPYQFEQMKDFSVGYLSGFTAEKRDIEKAAIAEGMQGEVREYARNLMRETISGYNSVTVRDSSFDLKKEHWNYVLLPVWTITYKAKNGKFYYYSMNGQTGKVFGELPVAYKKLTLVSGLVSLAALALGLIGGFLI